MDDKKITRNNKIVVLNDGQTWGSIKGAYILTLTEDELDFALNAIMMDMTSTRSALK